MDRISINTKAAFCCRQLDFRESLKITHTQCAASVCLMLQKIAKHFCDFKKWPNVAKIIVYEMLYEDVPSDHNRADVKLAHKSPVQFGAIRATIKLSLHFVMSLAMCTLKLAPG